MNIREIKIYIRDKYCDLVGKTPLIKQYNKITNTIASYSDNLPYGKTKDKLLEEFDKMDESRWVYQKGVAYLLSFNPYYSSNIKLRKKIAQGANIMKRYGILPIYSNVH